MKRYFNNCWLGIILLLFVNINSYPQTADELLQKIKSLPGVASAEEVKNDSGYVAVYKIMIEQLLNHNNAQSEKFTQKIYFSYKSKYAPVVISTEGYAAYRNYITEPTELLNANQIIVENRFFDESKPADMNWIYLTSEQCAADLHHVTTVLKKIFVNNKWVSTGISKGGQTCLFYRYYYPEDVNATIAYVAPINLAQENPEINKFISSEVGTKECRDKITQFQIDVLRHRKEIIPMVKKAAQKNKYKFSIGLENAFEFAVLEYPFSFWQWGKSSCNQIPVGNATPKQLFDELNNVSGFDLFSDKEGKYFQPLFYQSFTELGYYNFYYNSKEVLGLIKAKPLESYKDFLPENINVEYHPEVLQKINEWLQNKGNNIVYINGGNDPWSCGAGMKLIGKTNAIEEIKEFGTHATRIKDLNNKQRLEVITRLENWLGIIIN
jgi:PS-10 peptidase S37